tara:strand:+ start:95 stop:436 length:342 start_codon:yes stop_codon:yes gene_type:complete
MLEEMQLFCLMLLLVGHGLLIRGCTAMNQSIPASTDTISEKFDGVATVLDELADILADIGGPQQSQAVAKSGMGGSIPEMLTTFLMSQVMGGQQHGTQSQEWEVLPDDPSKKQ